jgi:hypothetical protein
MQSRNAENAKWTQSAQSFWDLILNNLCVLCEVSAPSAFPKRIEL